MGWRFSSMTLILDPPVPWKSASSFTLQPISDKAWSQLGLATWDYPRIKSMTAIYLAAVQLAMLTGHFSSIENLPEPDDIGRSVLHSYAKEQGKRIDAALSRLSQAIQEIISYVRENHEQLQMRPHLARVIELMDHAVSELIPSDTDDKIHLDLDGIRSWAERIRAVLPEVDMALLYWVNDVLDEVAEH
jgi:hypothetical protein